jgi:2-dehydropantoate 2-reductase
VRDSAEPADHSGPAPDIFIVGAGGIGCALGYALRAAGLDVTFVEVDAAKIAWGERHGVQVDRRPPLAARFVHFSDWRVPEGAVVLLCTKCFDNAAVLERLPASVILMPIQNGFDSAVLSRSAVEGISSFVSECLPDRPHTRITRRGDLHVGRWSANAGTGIPPAVEPLIRAWERFDAFRVRRVADVLPYKYSKLLYNAAISPLAAVAGLDNSQLLTLPQARRLFFRILKENYAILKAAGVPLGVIGPFHPDTVNRILGLPLIAWLMAWPFSLSLRNTYCSMSGEIPKGRTEIDYFNGHLLRLAGEGGAVLNRLCVEQVTRMSAERATPDRRWLSHLLDKLSGPTPRAAAE